MARLPSVSRLAVLSDIHLGRGDGRTGFSGDVEHLCAALQRIAENADAVVINGDLYDLDRGTLPTAQALEFRRLRPKWAAVEACMEKYGIRMTAGNHDRALLAMQVGGAKVHESYVVAVGQLNVRIEHGERFDAWIKRNRRFTSFVAWLSGWVSRIKLGFVYRILRMVERWTTDDKDGGQVERAIKWMKQHQEIDVLIMGHTHQKHVQRVGSQWLLNPGDAMHAKIHYLVIDGHEPSVTFMTIGEDQVSYPTQRLALTLRIGDASNEL